MSRQLVCTVSWPQGSDQVIRFAPNKDYSLHIYGGGPLGPHGLSPTAADLAELAASIFWIERRVRRRREPPRRFVFEFPVRDPDPWTPAAQQALSDVLRFLGNADWEISTVPRTAFKAVPAHTSDDTEAVSVTLLSGGLDSASGAATLDAASTRMVSFYTRQRTVQEEIAVALGHPAPVQFRLSRAKAQEPGRSFRYRSVLFLCLAAVASSSWRARHIYQFENGVLATAIPPSPAWLMTKHAHPEVGRRAARFFTELFGEGWTIENPFLTKTKRQSVAEARETVGDGFDKVARLTESCWHKWSNHVPGGTQARGKKRPGQQCGICIPCLVRATALPGERYKLDMSKSMWKNDDRFGRDYRAYYAFLDRVGRVKTAEDFFRLLPAAGRELWDDEAISSDELRALFSTFAEEFMERFGR